MLACKLASIRLVLFNYVWMRVPLRREATLGDSLLSLLRAGVAMHRLERQNEVSLRSVWLHSYFKSLEDTPLVAQQQQRVTSRRSLFVCILG